MEWNRCAYLFVAFLLAVIYARYLSLRDNNATARKIREQFWDDFEYDLDEWAKNHAPDEPVE